MWLWASIAQAAEAEPSDDAEVVVEAKRQTATASARSLDRAAVEAMPSRSADDLLRAMPGLHLSAHGGHGKAYQYFLRGFDAVHGADLAVDVEGVPVNEPSNVHAHGYLDLHLLPGVLVAGLDLHPGSWRAEAGDFATAGSASYALGLDTPGTLIEIGGGTDRSAEATVAWRPREAPAGSFVVADVDLGEGVGMARSYRQMRAAGGMEGTLGDARARAWLLAYDGVFDSPGTLREDDVTEGQVDFYDAYPGSGGGRSTRVLGSGSLAGGGANTAWSALLWGGWRSLELSQNFTGMRYDAEHGDGSRQGFDALSAGFSGRLGWAPIPDVLLRAGVQGRVDRVALGEAEIDLDGEVWTESPAQTATVGSVGVWGAAPLQIGAKLHVEPGVRADGFVLSTDGAALAWAPVLAPKLNVRLSELGPLDLFASYGRGFRSPDVRGAGDGGRAPIATTDGVELGASLRPWRWLALRAAGFGTYVSDEIIFDHVAARYVATGSTRRLGVDGGLRVVPIPQLRVDVDVTACDGVYVTTDAPIPYAPRLLVVGGVYAEAIRLGPTLLTAGLRPWLLGPRPLPEGFASHTVGVVDLTASLEWRAWRFGLDVDNLLGSEWRDGEFVFASHWDTTEAPSSLPVRHFTAGAPFAARLTVARRF
jgi:iron complex outermembrane recepter protein